MDSSVGFLATLDASMLSQRWYLVYQQAVHFLFWHCKYKPDGTGARRVFEHFPALPTAVTSAMIFPDPLPVGCLWFLVAGSFVHTLVFLRPHDTGGGRYITNCFEYKDAVGYVFVSIVRFIGTMCCRSCGVSLREGVCPGRLLLRFILWCFSGSLVFSWRLLVGSLWPGCMLCSRCRVQRVSLK